ncbi:cytoplasmic dynein 1 heavy chain 1 isoform X1 [Acipenser oxyrinchus oxyrinchus]|uniref:Cytoplasmic dynein 1 heavy chain 1 n=1 Tax=Acipenser oxyrinchus oxyrinchus TaxID=40147 RepID=A0AAD8D1F1_ACIOX|nr:cytoplasmic dynein 1 heavy chain 1 isoform X1 [Acipenser oxyrinchus oxyrinchus]KAK1160701.1 cytoplasmic dynein 1 heavy chain 1 isoform X1 [Acipenser oxyrinchus oxyrinchus]
MSDTGGGGGDDGSAAMEVSAAVQNVADASVLQKHIRKLVPLLLEDGGEAPASLETALEEKSTVEQMRKFLSDPQIHTVLVERSSLKEDVGDEGEEEKECISYNISIDIHYGLKSNSLAFIKRTGVIDADKPISCQLRVLTLSEDSPYETLHSFISNAVAPFFKSYIKESGKADRDGDKMAPSVEKKIAELEMGLLHLQQNIEIPEISLLIHPIITNVAKQSYERGDKPKVTDFADKVEDPTFLNQLQSGVNRWIREIQKVTKLDRDPASGTALQEISFWLNLERALNRIQEKRESPEVLLTLDILKHGKRFHATVSFDTDTGLKQAVETVNDYNPLMKDFPLNDLLSATELDKIRQALVAIFTHLRKIRNTKYPIQRALRLVEAISRDLSSQLLKVLGTRKLMHVAYEEFEKVMVACFEVFQTWDDEYEKLQVLLRDIVKRKREENLKMVWRINPAHRKLQARLDHMRRFRRQHEQLRAVIVRVLRPQVSAVPQLSQGEAVEPPDLKVAEVLFDAADANAIEEVNLAYENVKEVDGLDVSKEGMEAWEAAMKRYDERIDRVETRITARLRDQLGTAKNANEMFRIFSRFNALFVRPHIRGAIREYQTQLIQRVKDDIESLHDKFKVQYPQSQSCKMSHVRDLPPVSGSIIWAKQIDRQLTAYMKRVEDVLGKGWENHVEGLKLKQDGDSFRMKLNTQEIFDDWARKVQQRNLGVSGRIFTIESTRARGRSGNVLKLKVNFLPEIITLSKEVRNLKWLGFRVPLAIVNKAHQANQLYPFAISLIESVRTYERTCEKVEERISISLLVAGLKKEVQALIAEGIALVWESYKLDPYVQRLAETVFNFQEKVDDLLIIEEKIDLEVRSLETCMYDHKTFTEILNRVQKAVDDLNLHSYSNLPIWVNKLDMEIERILGVRLQAGLRAWTQVLLGQMEDKADVDMDTDTPQVSHKPGGEPKIKNVIHELRITNQVIYLNPPIEDCRYKLYQEMFAWKMVVLSLPRIQSQRYQVGVHYELSEEEKFYRNALTRMPDGPAALEEAYSAVKENVREVEQYVKVWLQYQCLWDMQAENIYNKLGEDLNKWQALLVQIRKARGTFDNAETRKEFGPVIIDYGKVQSKVNLKYDSWHKEVLSKFGQMLGQNMQDFHSQISKSRVELEQHSVDTASTSDAVTFITFVQSLKRKIKNFEKQVDLYRNGQRLLEKQRFQFPPSWLYIDNIDGEWGAFSDIMRRKDTAIQEQVANLQMKIVQEDRAVESRTTDLLTDWEKTKPVAGSLRPEEALQALTIYEGKFSRLKDDREKCAKAKEALELTDTGLLSGSEERVQVALEELQDLKGVWSELSKVWEQMDQMKEQSWVSVQPRKLRQNLDGLLNQIKNFPARLRQYASYEYVQRLLKGYMKINMLVIELKSEALKDRHWKQLMKRLHVNWVLSELTLGQIWDVDLQRNEAIVKDVLLVAQGEMALEEFLKQIREVWNSYELDLINYQNKCRLIRGWDDLFNRVREHINSVSAMKLSPYYKVFEEDALSWEDKLNRIMALFDVWIDVQRRWVYLEGIFTGSADIKHLLPVETQRFQSISTEFLALMKKVSKSPLVMDVLNIQGVQRSLERLADLLGKIQKALGEYLERERSSFPRFYFVGDEDLLEIIGNSKNVAKLQKHFKKMFAGVSSIILNEDSTVVLGISSREGEEILYKTPVSITEHPKINEWLTLVEKEMRVTLAKLLAESVTEVGVFNKGTAIDLAAYIDWIDRYQAQIVVLSAQIAWSENVENALNVTASAGDGDEAPVQAVLCNVQATLNVLADTVLMEQPPIRRRKLEHLITELVHQRDVTRTLIKNKIDNPKSFEWLSQMRFYFDPKQTDVLQQLSIQMANAKFNYGFEYLGVQDKLVQTPLTDRCYLTMTQALEARLGGSPFGPAGTGKTESVKALGHQLGRFVLVFNCDETFDFQAMGRIFVGLCQVGAWGCFDEFNRLEERMLSAVSQQVQFIQVALREHCNTGPDRSTKTITCELLNKQVKVRSDMAIFITMNPGYAGRSNLPDNLKKLFRSLAMTKPDRQLIAQVMLYSQGFRTAEILAKKIVPFFKLCDEQLSSQSHYDFGLRALKSVLVSAGNVKRERIQKIKRETEERGEVVDEGDIAENLPEQEILIQSVCETMVPKLVAEDIPLLFSLLSDVFPGVPYHRGEMSALREELKKVCAEMYLTYGGGEDVGGMWVEKVLQLYQITQINHGLMMVGPSGSGKTMAWRVLLKALERLEGVEGVAHIIDPKAISKDHLYGTLDPNTREWTDGLFTHVLRKIIDNVRGELQKRQWIIFDGDVDPEWVENLNSVLDDNKLLTLPNGERLSLPPNVRIMFEVQDLKYATLATVSRCGMVWFSEDVLSTDMISNHFLARLRNIPLDEGEDEAQRMRKGTEEEGEEAASPMLQIQRDAAAIMQPYFTTTGLVIKALEHASKMEHIMDFTRLRCLGSLFSMCHQACRNVAQFNNMHHDFPMQIDQLERYIQRYLVYAILWSFSGDSRLKMRAELGEYIRRITTIPLPTAPNVPIIDYEVSITGEWQSWQAKVPQIEVETHKVAAPDVVVPTLDTVRHEALLYTWLAEHKPLVLCGPPGSGKTMTLFCALRALPDMEVVGLNFSSATTPELLLKTFDHYCEYRRTPNGVVLAPVQLGKWLVLFCDEINLPDMDKYGTQRVISFIRQMVEHGGFYRTSDQTWVKLERIQFVGACNPPTDPGRKPLTHRFLRHVPVVYVDYPGPASLTQIYGTFNRAMLRLIPSLRTYAEPLTAAMVEFYTMSQERFTQDIQPHYIYSPREMTRWVRGIFEALRPLETLAVEGLIRIWAHEALRLFQDRLVEDEERRWTDENIDMVALKHFPNIDKEKALNKPILYSNWLSKDYVPVDQEELRDYVKARLKVFYEEELDVPLVLFNEVLDHVLRIDRIFRQPQGHLLLIGVSGAGKTTLSRFVAWMNGLSVYQIKVHRKYTGEDFDEDLRTVLRRSGCKNEKIAFIMDESNVLDSGFLERMNTLLANGEVPGLFEGDEYATLMTQCKEGAQKEGLMLDTHEELYKWFTSQVIRNLHVVFTMNPSSEGLKDRAATSPALFNRCVLNWFGDWSTEALYQVGKEFTSKMDLEKPNYVVPDYMPIVYDKLPQPPSHREAIVNSCVFVHQTLHQANNRLAKRGGRTMAITPRHYLDFINHYANLFNEKRSELEEQQMHLNVGLRKIKETVDQVEELRRDLRIKSQDLDVKNVAANDKLKKMVKDQQEAEKKKVMSQEIQESVYKQQEIIKDKQMKVKEDLDMVEPAVLEAQNAVKSIKKQHLVEVRSMANPPGAVKLALESICLLLGESTTDWKQIRSIIMRENFIPTIVNFSADEISDSIREKMKKNYMSNPSFNYELVNRASLACGPMVKWAIAQLNYADVLKRVEPLRNELQKLEDDAMENQSRAEEVEQMIRDLESSIARYKEEYAVLISEAQAIKADLAAVEAKVNRSTALLKSLSAERDRWEKTSETFKNQMSTIAGDCCLSAAFIAYAGYFDQQMRQNLFTTWSHHMQQANIQFRTDIARTEYLSNADERLRWQANSLPADDLCTENAIMLKRFNRYPLIIDPSGQATEFIMNEYKERKITRTSFLDDAFRKNLESALRFGNPLLVQDVESYDPILNPVLNREVRRTGGRVLITLGDQDIDLSPSFVIFLSTRDPTVEFPPDLCSRVTFVNFTVTRSSLQSQCLNEVLKAERPDVDEKRSDLLKLQGEFQLRLRQLEKSLLQALNEVKGRILDDDTIITTLENLKKEAAEVTRKVEETDIVMQEVETVSQQYLTLSTACSSIYFTMEALNQIHFLYQYSLHLFLDIYHTVLYENANLKGITDHTHRLSIITKDLFQIAFNRVARGMLHHDHITFAMLMARIYLKGINSEPSYDAEFQHFLRGKEIVLTGSSVPKVKELTSDQAEAMVRLSRLPAFKDLVSKVEADEQIFIWLESSSPEQTVPYLWTEEKPATPIGQAVHQLLLIQAFRPDRLLAVSHNFVAKVLGESFMAIIDQPLDLGSIVDSEVKPSTPVLMCSVPGYDASGLVRDLAAEQNKQITSVSIGSAEGFNKADRDINTAVKSGRWVMLENVHLAPGWLMQLEKKLHSMQPHACFRLFLTMEINPKVPVNLLRAGRIFVFEPPPGVKANMLRTFSSIPVARMCKAPNERARLYFLLAWFHAIIQERLRYAPLGWSKKYEFGESDLRSACDTVDTWLDDTAKGRQNISPDKIPWAALKTLMAQSIYGGRIDNEFDQRLLNTFLERIFTTGSFDSEFKLASKVDGHKDIQMPDGIRREEFVHWVEMLPDTQTPSWLGLPSNAEKVLLTTQGIDMIRKMLKMQLLEDEDDLAYETEKKQRTNSTPDSQPAWMRTLHTTACNWLQLIPQTLNHLKRTVENIKDPLFRFFEREVKMGARMLHDVRQDLTDVIQVCEGKKKQTNDLRTLINELVKGILPRSWSRYTVPASMTVIQWVTDFSDRIKQLQQISQAAASGGAKELKNIHVCLGGLFVPEAYITATRQYVAQANSWSLEELCLEVNVTTSQNTVLDACSFGIKGLKLQGATCSNNKLSLSNTISTELPLTQLHWLKQTSTEKKANAVTLPVYLNFTRADLIFTVDFDIATKEGPHSFYERGVAVLCTE